MANKRRNNRLPVYISGDAFSCFSFTVTALHDDVHIYIYEGPTCHQRERKERKRGDRVGSFRPTGGEALRGSFCHLVVSFYGSSPSSSRIQTERTAYTKRRLSTILLRLFRFLLCPSLCLSPSATEPSFFDSAKLSSNFISFSFLFSFFLHSSGPFE